jgi:mannonate dehydratase
MRTLKQVGFRGIMLTDHVPRMSGDTAWGHRGRAYTVGYMKALLQVLESHAA